MPESARTSPIESKSIRFERVAFKNIPGQSKLFLDYLRAPDALSEWYPNAVVRHVDLIAFAPTVLKAYTTDRTVLCDVLERQNRSYGCEQSTRDNIKRLRQNDCVAVLSGQQAGLFTGPLYTIYKALSAIRSAEELRAKGLNAVPVFWVATEDHDFDEVSKSFNLSKDGSMIEVGIGIDNSNVGKPVGSIELSSDIEVTIDRLFDKLPQTEFSLELSDQIRASYKKGETLGSSFGKLITSVFRKHGLIIFDPMDPAAKNLTSTIVQAAVARSEEIVTAMIERSEKLIADGYHAQVHIEGDYFPFFWIDKDGVRRSLRRTLGGEYKAVGTRTEFSLDQLLEIARSDPQRLSAGVMLRPVVQDFLFPTICYYGGAAEIAYFAQNSEAYRILDRPVTTILPRQGFTIVEAKLARTMKKYGFTFRDLFAGIDNLWPDLVERMIDPETPRVFAEVEEYINTELNRLDQQLSKIDPTLSDSLAKRRRKIVHHIGALRAKFQRVHIQKDEIINRQVAAMFSSLLPNGGLQERTLNFSLFTNRYGPQFIDWLYDSIDLDDNDHNILYL